MAETRGSWTLDEAIAERWDAQNLDAAFRAEWLSPSNAEYVVLHDSEARPTPPGPYCVFSRDDEPEILGHMSGKTSTTENQLQQLTFQFMIHAKSTTDSAGANVEDAKSICRRLAKLVAKAFDNAVLVNSPDGHVVTIRGPDFPVREGDEEWAWVLRYDVVLDAEYDTTPAT